MTNDTRQTLNGVFAIATILWSSSYIVTFYGYFDIYSLIGVLLAVYLIPVVLWIFLRFFGKKSWVWVHGVALFFIIIVSIYASK